MSEEEHGLPLDLADVDLVLNGFQLAQLLADMVRDRYWSDWFILEAGSGTGKFGMFYAKHYHANVTLLDLDVKQIARSITLLRLVEVASGRRIFVSFREGNILNLPWQDNTFHFVYNEGVNEHWARDDPRRLRAIQEMVRVSKDYVGMIVPDADGERSRKRAGTTEHVYPSMPPKETPYTATELQANMELAGLSNIRVERWSDPGTQEFILGVGRKG